MVNTLMNNKLLARLKSLLSLSFALLIISSMGMGLFSGFSSDLLAQTQDKTIPLRNTAGPRSKAIDKKPAELDWNEIRSKSVRFQNYNAKKAPTRMRAIDQETGQSIASGLITKNLTKHNGFIVRRIFEPENPGFGADIISITKKARVGHINRIHRIIASYLQKSFKFSPKDIKIASRFILYYNARNRGNAKYIKTRFSDKVYKSIDHKKIGLDRSYKNWAGKSEILIPLRKNLLNAKNTGINLKEIDKGTKGEAKALRDKLRDTEKRRNQAEREGLAKRSSELKQDKKSKLKERKILSEKQKKIIGQNKKLRARLRELQKDPKRNAKKIEEVKQKQSEITKQGTQNKAKSRELTSKINQNKKKQLALKKQQVRADTRSKELTLPKQIKSTNKKTEIAQLKAENKQLKSQVNDKIVAEKILFLRVVRHTRKGHYKNELWYLDVAKNDTLFRSPYVNICSRKFSVIPNKGVLLTGYSGDIDSNTDHRLVLLDSNKLTKIKQSKVDVHWATPLIYRDNKIFAFTKVKDKFYLARFDTNLKLEIQSKDSINPYSDLSFYKNKIYLTGQSRKDSTTTIHVFSREKLSTIKAIKP